MKDIEVRKFMRLSVKFSKVITLANKYVAINVQKCWVLVSINSVQILTCFGKNLLCVLSLKSV
jgi:hypothetical protein